MNQKEELDAQHLLDVLHISRSHDLVAGQTARESGSLVLQVVTAVSLLPLELARTGELEALLGATVGLLLRHSCRSPYVFLRPYGHRFMRYPIRVPAVYMSAGHRMQTATGTR